MFYAGLYFKKHNIESLEKKKKKESIIFGHSKKLRIEEPNGIAIQS